MITSRENSVRVRRFFLRLASSQRSDSSFGWRAFYNSVFVMPFVKTAAAMTLVLADWVIITIFLRFCVCVLENKPLLGVTMQMSRRPRVSFLRSKCDRKIDNENLQTNDRVFISISFWKY